MRRRYGRLTTTTVITSFLFQYIDDAYARQCSRNCDCQPMPEKMAQDPHDFKVGDVNLIGTPGRPGHVVSRLNPDGAAMGPGACLAGEVAG